MREALRKWKFFVLNPPFEPSKKLGTTIRQEVTQYLSVKLIIDIVQFLKFLIKEHLYLLILKQISLLWDF